LFECFRCKASQLWFIYFGYSLTNRLPASFNSDKSRFPFILPAKSEIRFLGFLKSIFSLGYKKSAGIHLSFLFQVETNTEYTVDLPTPGIPQSSIILDIMIVKSYSC